MSAAWNAWALASLQVGLVVIDQKAEICFMNRWLCERAQLPDDLLVQGQPLTDVFPALRGTFFELSLKQAMRSGFPVLLSQSLHPSPLPLYVPNAQRNQDRLLRQSVRIVPMNRSEAQDAGQRYTLIQVMDMTPSVLRERILKAQAVKLQDMAHMDALTGLGNRRLIDEVLPAELHEAQRTQRPLGLIMFDVDAFKQYNDRYGHVAGDAALRLVGDVLREVCRRPRDRVARYGGEELVAILPDTDAEGCVRVAHQVLRTLYDRHLPHDSSDVTPWLTLSAGLSLAGDAHNPSPESLIAEADRALYAAKEAGRNRVCRWDAAQQSVVSA